MGKEEFLTLPQQSQPTADARSETDVVIFSAGVVGPRFLQCDDERATPHRL